MAGPGPAKTPGGVSRCGQTIRLAVGVLPPSLLFEFLDIEFLALARIEFARARRNFSAQPRKRINPLKQLTADLLLRRLGEIRHLRKGEFKCLDHGSTIPYLRLAHHERQSRKLGTQSWLPSSTRRPPNRWNSRRLRGTMSGDQQQPERPKKGGQFAGMGCAVLLLLPGACFLHFGLNPGEIAAQMSGKSDPMLLSIAIVIFAVAAGMMIWGAIRRK